VNKVVTNDVKEVHEDDPANCAEKAAVAVKSMFPKSNPVTLSRYSPPVCGPFRNTPLTTGASKEKTLRFPPVPTDEATVAMANPG
jgi:hypothetical protein